MSKQWGPLLAGLYETYRQLEIPRERELQWGREENGCLLEEFFAKDLVVDNTLGELIELIKNSDDVESLRSLLGLVRSEFQNLDTMTLVLIAERILRLRGSTKHSGIFDSEILLEEEQSLVEALLKRANTMKFCVAKAYRESGHLKNFLSEDQIRERIRKGFRDLDAYKASTDSSQGKFWRWLQKCVGRPEKEG